MTAVDPYRESSSGLVTDLAVSELQSLALQKLLEDTQLRTSLGLAGQAKVRAEYSIDDNIAKLCTLFERSQND